MTPVVIARHPRGKGLRSRAAKRRKANLSRTKATPIVIPPYRTDQT